MKPQPLPGHLPLATELRRARIWRRTLRLFLPLSAAAGLVLVPLILLYEQGRHQVIATRLTSELTALALEQRQLLATIRTNAGVASELAGAEGLFSESQPSGHAIQAMDRLLQAQLRNHAGYSAIALYRQPGVLLSLVRPGQQPWQNSQPAPVAGEAIRQALAISPGLPLGAIWLSSIQPLGLGGSSTATVLAVQRLNDQHGNPQGTLIYANTPGSLTSDFDQILAQQRGLAEGFLVDQRGRILNQVATGTSPAFNTRFPQVWRQLQQRSSGNTLNSAGLFVFARDDSHISPDPSSAPGQQHRFIVLRVPPAALGRTSAFQQPVGRIALLLLWLGLAGASLIRAHAQEQLDEQREQQRLADERFQLAFTNSPVGMALLDRQGLIQAVNAAFCRFLERDASQLIDAPWLSLIQDTDQRTEREQLQTLLEGNNPSPHQRILHFCSGNDWERWGDRRMVALAGRTRETAAAIIQVADVTPLIQREAELSVQREKLETILDTMVDPYVRLTAVQDPDNAITDFRLEDVNRAASLALGHTQQALEGQLLSGFDPPLLLAQIREQLLAHMALDTPLILNKQPIRNSRSHSTAHWDLRGVRLGNSINLIWLDVTDKTESARRLAESETLFRLLLQNTQDAVFLEVKGTIRWISPAVEAMLGWPTYRWMGQPLLRFCHPDAQAQLEALTQAKLNQGHQVMRLQLLDQHRIGRWVELRSSDYCNDAGERLGWMGSFRVVENEVAAELQLKREATQDSLTTLLNRRGILSRLAAQLTDSQQRHQALGVLFCDIDHFKQINDSHGHAAGDAVLQTIARRLNRHVRQGDGVGRLGGDELLVTLHNVRDAEETLRIALHLHQQLCEPIPLAGGNLTPTLSIGVTLARAGESADALLERADAAMYAAKQAGRNRVVSLDQADERLAR